MNRIYLYAIIFSFFGILSGCQEDPEIWDSSTADFDGNWYVQYNHETLGEDPFGEGLTTLYTYNTASNDGAEIWFTDEGGFWDYKVRIPVNQASLTFGSTSEVTSIIDGYEIKVIVNNGKIIKNAVELPSGAIVDSIYFEVWFEDLQDATEIENDKLIVGGHRKSGFEEDEPH
ncbi:lipid-binding protein [Sunxiuqinia elliptica]|uniref:Lipid-binding putative hydrolase n=1 Tax=Sunxiuqinia elliptica TaxID=655355 RepID=A0A1I2A6S4_9BACT|nr:lipid-binding protein [Sunxiuqinia elliptica]SFE39621.1 Lipid-binding putative hydrolase [Sunxiuqinia elliptica]